MWLCATSWLHYLAEATSQPAPAEVHHDVVKTHWQWSTRCRKGMSRCALVCVCDLVTYRTDWWCLCSEVCDHLWMLGFSLQILLWKGWPQSPRVFILCFSNYSMLVFGLVTRKYFKILELWLCDLDTRSIEIPQITAALTALCQEHSQTDTHICRYRLLELHCRLCSIKMLF